MKGVRRPPCVTAPVRAALPCLCPPAPCMGRSRRSHCLITEAAACAVAPAPRARPTAEDITVLQEIPLTQLNENDPTTPSVPDSRRPGSSDVAPTEQPPGPAHRSSFTRMQWYFSFGMALVGCVMGVIGPITDISTIVVYFRSGDVWWGFLSAYFVSVAFIFVNVINIHDLRKAKAASLPAFRSSPLHNAQGTAAWLCVLGLFPALLKLDEMLFWRTQWRSGQVAYKYERTVIHPRQNWLGLVEFSCKTIPNLALHAYILIVNQLSPEYAGRRLQGAELLSQVVNLKAHWAATSSPGPPGKRCPCFSLSMLGSTCCRSPSSPLA